MGTVVYVGANTRGMDGKVLLDICNCTIHMYEPVPQYFAQLVTLWDKFKDEFGYNATLYNYGLGGNDRSIQFSFHFFHQVPNLVPRYCKIKTELNKTHNMIYGQSFGWERWDLMNKDEE